MVVKSIIALVLLCSVRSFAANYACGVAKISKDGPQYIGIIKVTPSTGKMSNLDLNNSGDMASCGGLRHDSLGKDSLICLFKNKDSNVRIIPSVIKGQFIAVKNNTRTGEVSVIPIAATYDNAETLSLALMLETGIYGITCFID